MSDTDPVIENPTYLGDIRHFFREIDVDHMNQKGIDIGTYDGVKEHAVQIYSATSSKQMPPDPAGQWSENRCTSFLNWMKTGYAKGEPSPAAAPTTKLMAGTDRIRKNAASLSTAEIDLLGKAFQGIMGRGSSAKDGYFYLAGLHGLPKAFCQHHNDPFNPWHRVYLKMFEDALRSVDGCADVTLPYWDISAAPPAWLSQAPFGAYTFPETIGNYAKGSATRRYDAATIESNLKRFDFFADFNRALTQGRWGVFSQAGGGTGNGFQQWSIQAHDTGHVSTGPTMADQNYASYDPIFWFYHCNLDRHWLSWQTLAGGLDWTTFQTLLPSLTFWQTPLNQIAPFTQTTDQTIAFGIGYDELLSAPQLMKTQKGRVGATAEFALGEQEDVAVHVEGIARLEIPGSFTVDLLADGEVVASRAFFQPEKPKGCKTCATIPLVGLEMRVPRSAIAGKTLSVNVEVPGQADEIGARFPLLKSGAPRGEGPTVRVSIPLEEN